MDKSLTISLLHCSAKAWGKTAFGKSLFASQKARGKTAFGKSLFASQKAWEKNLAIALHGGLRNG